MSDDLSNVVVDVFVDDDEDATGARNGSYLEIVGDENGDVFLELNSPTRSEKGSDARRLSSGGSILEDSRAFAAEFVHSTQTENDTDSNFVTKDATVVQQELDRGTTDTLDTPIVDATAMATTTDIPDVTVDETETDTLLAPPTQTPTDDAPTIVQDSRTSTPTPGLKKARAFMVCAFEIGKPVTIETLTRTDVLELARNTLLPQLSLRLRPKNFKQSAHPKPSHSRANSQGARRLHTRDLRKLDLGSGKTEPIIMARLDAIIVMIPPIRAVILAHKCLVFVNEGADSEIAPLYDWLDGDSHDTNPAPFELKALEAVLEAVFLDRRREFKGLVTSKKLVLGRVVKKASAQDLNELRALKNETNKSVARAQALSRLFRGILDQEDDMAMMRLTARKRAGNELDTEDVELLLENYLQDAQEVQRSLEGIVGEIDATERMVEIQLDTARNTLLLYGFVLSVVTAACSVASMFFGAFGMNLETGLENSRDNFRLVFGVLMAFVIISPITLLVLFHRRGMLA
eukprot:m.93272 g.93272  ORF g.93272 m.93272 type:complete len:517 (+) comp26620_c0_seq3:218-1768(+)